MDKPPFNSDSLKIELEKTKQEREPIIEGFLYKDSTLMIAGDTGSGKSVINTEAIACLSCASPLFKALNISKPRISYYILFERTKDEILERLKKVRSVIPFDCVNIFIDDQLVGKNVLKESDSTAIIKRIQNYCPTPDVIFLDPIYACVSGGLSTDEGASAFCRFSTMLQKTFSCSLWLTHHTHRPKYMKNGDKLEEDDPFYGSVWLKAHLTASYHLKRQGQNSVMLDCKKDSQSNLLSKMLLHFDHETYTCQMDDTHNPMKSLDRLAMFIRACKRQNRKFNIEEMTKEIGVSRGNFFVLLQTPLIAGSLAVSKAKYGKNLYEVAKDI